MEPVTLTAAATVIATIVLTKALEKTGEKLGEAALDKSRELIEQLHNKNKLPLLADATQQPLDYGKAVLELKAAADVDTEIAQSVREVESAANADPQVAPKVQALANDLNSQPAGVINSTKLADSIKNVIQGNTFIGTNNFWLYSPERQQVKLNPPTETPQNLPLSGVVEFVGREAELQNLHEMLQENNQCRPKPQQPS